MRSWPAFRSAALTRHLSRLCFLAALLLGCYLGSGQKSDGPAAADRWAGEVSLPSGLPCPVADLLATHCVACHGATAPTALASLADLRRLSKSDPTKTAAALAVIRMKAGSMPPAGSPAPGAAAIASFEAWVNQGLPAGSCSAAADAGPDPFAGPHVCTSGSTYQEQDGQNATMEPGNACITCHTTSTEGEAPQFTVAGTVYPTGHEPSRCRASGVAGAQVVIVDANGLSHTSTVNSVGNFWSLDAIPRPFTARVELAGRTRAMATPQTNGDCNACHTENGASGAPGRIVVP